MAKHKQKLTDTYLKNLKARLLNDTYGNSDLGIYTTLRCFAQAINNHLPLLGSVLINGLENELRIKEDAHNQKVNGPHLFEGKGICGNYISQLIEDFKLCDYSIDNQVDFPFHDVTTILPIEYEFRDLFIFDIEKFSIPESEKIEFPAVKALIYDVQRFFSVIGKETLLKYFSDVTIIKLSNEPYGYSPNGYCIDINDYNPFITKTGIYNYESKSGISVKQIFAFVFTVQNVNTVIVFDLNNKNSSTIYGVNQLFNIFYYHPGENVWVKSNYLFMLKGTTKALNDHASKLFFPLEKEGSLHYSGIKNFDFVKLHNKVSKLFKNPGEMYTVKVEGYDPFPTDQNLVIAGYCTEDKELFLLISAAFNLRININISNPESINIDGIYENMVSSLTKDYPVGVNLFSGFVIHYLISVINFYFGVHQLTDDQENITVKLLPMYALPSNTVD